MNSPFSLKEIRVLLEMLEKFDVSEFKLELENERIWLKRGKVIGSDSLSSAVMSQQAQQQVVAYETARPLAPYIEPPEKPTLVSQEEKKAQDIKSVSPVSKSSGKPLAEVTSPMVGTFYRRPAVDAEPYVQVGDMVKKGDVLCIVEAMKLMNEIESEMSGRITEVCLEDGQMVEYGEVLFRIESV